MPILADETSIFPEDLLDGGLTATERRWWVVYTKVRQEKSLARQLLAMETPFFLPLVRKQHMYRGRKVHSHLPLFTSYLFLFASEEERVRGLAVNSVAQLLPVRNQLQLESDLKQIRLLIEAGVPLTVESRLKPGQRVQVQSGAMQGLVGTVQSRRGKTRLIVAVDFLNQGVSLEIEDFQLTPVD